MATIFAALAATARTRGSIAPDTEGGVPGQNRLPAAARPAHCRLTATKCHHRQERWSAEGVEGTALRCTDALSLLNSRRARPLCLTVEPRL